MSTPTVLSLTIAITGTWTAEFQPQPDDRWTWSAGRGYADEWREHIAAGDWTLADGAVYVDYRPCLPDGLLKLPNTCHKCPRGQIQRFGTGPGWGIPKVHLPIDWDAPDFGAGSIDAVHPLDYAEMLKRRGVCVMPLADVAYFAILTAPATAEIRL